MTAAAQKVTIVVHEFPIEAYQLTEDGQNLLLFTHRQIGEIVGKTKGTAQLASLKGKGQRAKGKRKLPHTFDFCLLPFA